MAGQRRRQRQHQPARQIHLVVEGTVGQLVVGEVRARRGEPVPLHAVAPAPQHAGMDATPTPAAYLGATAEDRRALLEELHAMLAETSAAHAALQPKPWYTSRTLWANAVALGLAAAEVQLHLLKDTLGVDAYTLLAFGMPVVNAMLRVITTAPLTGGGLGA